MRERLCAAISVDVMYAQFFSRYNYVYVCTCHNERQNGSVHWHRLCEASSHQQYMSKISRINCMYLCQYYVWYYLFLLLGSCEFLRKRARGRAVACVSLEYVHAHLCVNNELVSIIDGVHTHHHRQCTQTAHGNAGKKRAFLATSSGRIINGEQRRR